MILKGKIVLNLKNIASFAVISYVLVIFLWNFLTGPSDRYLETQMKFSGKEEGCEIDGVRLYHGLSVKNTFWQHYFKGVKNISGECFVLYKDDSGKHPFFSYEYLIGNGCEPIFIENQEENIVIIYNASNIVFSIKNNPFKKHILFKPIQKELGKYTCH